MILQQFHATFLQHGMVRIVLGHSAMCLASALVQHCMHMNLQCSGRWLVLYWADMVWPHDRCCKTLVALQLLLRCAFLASLQLHGSWPIFNQYCR